MLDVAPNDSLAFSPGFSVDLQRLRKDPCPGLMNMWGEDSEVLAIGRNAEVFAMPLKGGS